MKKALAQRLVTSLIGAPLGVAAVLFLPSDYVFAIVFLAFFWAAVEFIAIVRPQAPSAPLGLLWLLIPAAAIGGFLAVRQAAASDDLGVWLALAGWVLVTVAAGAALFGGTTVHDGLITLGTLTFAVPYFAVPAVACYRLHLSDPWLLFALLAIVWLGDTAAFFVGSAIGRHPFAPVVSPKKSWEGSLAGLAAAVLATAVWSQLRLGEVRPWLLVVAALTAVVAQIGDLVESLIKRGAGVKDSANTIPGHGGFFDRMDALILAAPAFLAGTWILGLDALSP